MKEALLSVPGISVEDPGYHAQAYQESSYGSQTVRVNGDNRVLILIDGKRMDVGVGSASGSSRSKANVAMLTSIDNIDRIEVVKGQGSLAYGSDATSVINIITKRGTLKPTGKVTVDFGSWGQQDYKLSHSGSVGSWRYNIGGTLSKGDDTKYRDAYLGKTITYKNSKYKDKSAFISLGHDFNEQSSIDINYNHQSTKDHFPISALDYEHPTPDRNHRASWTPGYRNIFKGDQDDGVYTQTLINDVDATYTFKKDHGIPSYVRAYKTYHRYYEMDGVGWTPTDEEYGTGIEGQYGKLLRGKDVFITGFEYKKGKHDYNEGAQEEGQDPSTFYRERTKRNDYGIYVQDKIKVSDKLVVTPGLRYSHYGSAKITDSDGGSENYKSYHRLTGGLFSSYEPNNKTEFYASWSQLFNAPFATDIRKNHNVKPEKGNIYTVGMKYKFNDRTNIGVHYSYSDIDDAILRYSYENPDYNPDTMKLSKKWINRVSNVNQTKKSIGIDLSREFSAAWSATLSYVHTSTNQVTPRDNENPYEDEIYQKWYPQNMYKLNVTYHKGKWDNSLYATVYTGAAKSHFTDSEFFVWDTVFNYHVNESSTVFFKFLNMFNESYETRASAWGRGAFPQPARRFVIGCEYKF